ncbi:transposase [Paraburkholderia sediminicola]|uniref:IS4/Tn5 family transposase DNA-binding protein n=1 Tax=Paraburkholderia TaxID=1822464 RepID=UPI0038BE10B2
MKNRASHKWAHQTDEVVTPDDGEWLDREVAGSNFQDGRLATRFRTLLDRLWRSVGQSIPLACQDWAQTKAAYRFLANDRVSEHDIFEQTLEAPRIDKLAHGWLRQNAATSHARRSEHDESTL